MRAAPAAHGFFECYEALTDLTKAAPVPGSRQAHAGLRPLLDRAGRARLQGHGARRARLRRQVLHRRGQLGPGRQQHPGVLHPGRDEVPDLVHAVKPEPHHQMPQAASAHDTFWDFVSLMPESTHMLMWVMSDRGDPAQLRDACRASACTPTAWSTPRRRDRSSSSSTGTPKAGTHSLVWDEAVKISGADPDFHRRDLWERIEAGAYPEYELAVQVFTEEQADQLQLRRPRRDQDRPGGTGAAAAAWAAWC